MQRTEDDIAEGTEAPAEKNPISKTDFLNEWDFFFFAVYFFFFYFKTSQSVSPHFSVPLFPIMRRQVWFLTRGLSASDDSIACQQYSFLFHPFSFLSFDDGISLQTRRMYAKKK
eukprot:TRINITY_DN1074_c6_g1_i1.p1 TRINITY_DN1074_c6_g1~~TRINITY_DN1074_c6_g1_i1.p1  ORF type:complete len:114 (-),score=8.08 TRINITY_DN1074_c6_g1_i1:309-650(-)